MDYEVPISRTSQEITSHGTYELGVKTYGGPRTKLLPCDPPCVLIPHSYNETASSAGKEAYSMIQARRQGNGNTDCAYQNRSDIERRWGYNWLRRKPAGPQREEGNEVL